MVWSLLHLCYQLEIVHSSYSKLEIVHTSYSKLEIVHSYSKLEIVHSYSKLEIVHRRRHGKHDCRTIIAKNDDIISKLS